MPTLQERTAFGRALREDVPRSSHGEFVRDGSVNAVELVLSQEQGRLESLLPVRRQRMAESAFAYYRAGALLMATDLAATPRSGILVQASGDAHLSNFGWYGSPERDLVFDANDFDETLRAAWEWDLKRLCASFVIGSQDNGFDTKAQRKAARAAARAYQKAMEKFATMPALETWYAQVSADDLLERYRTEGRARDLRRVRKGVRKASKRDSRHVLGKLVERVDDKYRIIHDPPFVVPIRAMDSPISAEEAVAGARDMFESYVDSVEPAIRNLISRFHVVDIALKVVGVGSVGTRCFIAMLEGNGAEDVLFLQIKEAGRSVLEDEFGDSQHSHDGERVVQGQRLMQTTSDIMLGWASTAKGHDYYIRQLKDMKASPRVERFDPDDMRKYAGACGVVLAHAHARGGDPAEISGYIGSNDTFADAVTDFSLAYATQNQKDYEAFLNYVGNSSDGG